MKKSNIWIMNHHIAPPSIEHQNRHVWFSKYLSKKGHKVFLFCASTVKKGSESLIKDNSKYITEKDDFGKYIIINTRKFFGNKKNRILNMIDFYQGLMKNYKEIINKYGSPEVIYASSVHPLTLVAGIKIAKKLNVPCICEVRDLWPETLVEFGSLKKKSILAKLLYAGEKWIYKKADKLIFTMEGGKEYIKDKKWDKEIDLNKVYHINNGIDLEAFNQNLTKNTIEDFDLTNKETFKVIYTGTIGIPNKVDVILKTAKLIKERGLDKIIFLIYGDGVELEKLINYKEKNNLENVIFKNRVEKKYIPYILSNSNLNIFTGAEVELYKYGLSLNKLFDYLASGKPSISNMKCGKYDILKKYDCGITIESNDFSLLADKIIGFYNMPPEKYNEYCKNALIASKDFDFKKLTDNLERIFINPYNI